MPSMARRTPRRGNLPVRRGDHGGRPSKLTERTEDTIIGAVLEGNHLTTAAAAAGISVSTLHRWVDVANDIEEAIESGKPYDVDGLRYLEFRDRLADARAQAEMRAVAVVQKQMQGGYLVHERPLQNVQGDPLYDQDGKLLVERTYAQPDGRLALAYLGRSRPGQWGQSSQNRVELTGAGGGPVQVEHTGDQISALADRLAEVAAAFKAEDAETDDGEGGEVFDAEVVNDPEETQ